MKDTPRYLDATGMHCPQPVIRCKATLSGMQRGALLYVDVTDSGSAAVIPRLIAALGDELVEIQRVDCVSRFIIRRRGVPAGRGSFSLRERVAAWMLDSTGAVPGAGSAGPRP